MGAGDWTEFFFFGAFALPAVLLFAGAPDIAVLAFIILVLAACLSGAYDEDAPFRSGARARHR